MGVWKETLQHQKAIRAENLHVKTSQRQSSELNLPGTIVPWRDIFDKW